MATNILLKSSATAAKVPTTSTLSLRELAINTTDGRLFFRQGTGVAGDSILEVATLTGTQTLSNKTENNLTLTGTLTAGGGVGTNGQVLTSTGTGVQWSSSSGGLTITDDTSTNATRYLTFTSATSGSISSENTSSTKLTFNPSTGNLSVGGSITANSDISLKKNIKTISNSLNKTLSLRGVEFDWKENGEHQIGFIAQEVEKILPELVKESDNGIKSVAYQNIVALLVEAIKEQNTVISSLSSRIESLEFKV